MPTNDDSDALRASPEPQIEPEMKKLRKKIPSSHFQDFMKSEGFGDHSKDINYQKFKDEFPGLVRIGRDYAAFSVFKVSEEEHLVVLTAGYYRVGQGRLLRRSRDMYNEDGGRLVEHIRKSPDGEKRYSDDSRAGAYASGTFKEVKPAFLINKSGELKVTKHVYFNHVLDSNEKKSFEKEVAITSRYIESKGHVGIVRHVAGVEFPCSNGITLQKVTGVQPYLGDSLQDYMDMKKKHGKFEVSFLKDLFGKVVKELKFLGRYVHGDLKPANMTFKQGSGGESEVGLIDFGFAEEVGKEFNRVTNPWDTCQYFDPFRLSGYCAASDVFTLAFVMLAYQSSSFNKEAEKFLTYICLKLDATMSLENISKLLVNDNASESLIGDDELPSLKKHIKECRKKADKPEYAEAFKYFSIEDFYYNKHKVFNFSSKGLAEDERAAVVSDIKSLEGDNLKIAVSLCEKYGFNSSVLGNISSLKDDNLKIAVSLYEKDGFNSSVLGNISRLEGDKLEIAALLCKEDGFNREVFNKIANLEDDCLKTELASLCELIRALGEYCKREDRHPAKNSAATEFQNKLKAMMAEFISQPNLSTTRLKKMLTDLVRTLDPKTKSALFTNSICEFSLSFWKINVSMRSWECSTLGGLLSHFKIFSEENKRLEHAVSDYDYHNRMINDPNDPNDPNDYFSTEESFGR